MTPIAKALLLAVLLSATPAAAEPWLMTGRVGLLLEDFDYEETDPGGAVIDTERGRLAGISATAELARGGWLVAAALGLRRGDVDYRAYPSSSGTLRSRTDEEIGELEIVTGLRRPLGHAQRIDLFGGLGFRRWDREIRSLPGASGLDERYAWPYLTFGVRPVIQTGSDHSLGLSLALRRAFAATLGVEFKGGNFDPVELDLDNGLGVHAELVWDHSLGGGRSVALGGYLDLWRFDASDRITLTRGGVPSDSTVHEPASTTRSAGIRLELVQRF